MKRYRNRVLRSSKTLYLLSLVLPAYETPQGYTFGVVALLMGPIGLIGLQFTWLANPLVWLAWTRTRDHEYAASNRLMFVALLIACSFLLYREIHVGSAGSFDFTAHIGYYVWVLSIATGLAANSREFRPALLTRKQKR